ncbi:PAS domain S-box protein [Solidesulfovibrio sp.]|uniref:PAS domain S-box protein n=1 Tax=Solidesulfovibrio sp. TaxID=2910990 RepID=UPI002B214086|nr:PAS domain S-box protein [Solidesulfovibrio sp.]MEA4858476.1 PAS domain S-box protein [Solidesulfovibrio sp.]
MFLLALLALGVLQAQAQPTPTPPRSLSVVMDHDYPPYVFRDDKGVAQGILVDSWRLWEKGTGVPVTIVAMDWNAAQDLMRRGKADVIDTLFETEERLKDYAFSPATATIDVPVFVHKDLGGIRDAASLRGFPVGVKRGDASVERLTAQGVGPLVYFDDYEAVIRAAGDGRIKVFCVDKPPALHYLYKFGLEQDFRLAFSLYSGQFHRAVRKGDEALLHFVENGFARLTPRQYEEIERRWRGEILFPAEKFRYALLAVAGLAVAAAVLLTVNALLRRTVRRQTERLRDLLAAAGQSERRYRELVESAASVIVRLDSLGRVVFCNTFAQRVFGHTQEQLLGREFGQLTDAPGEDAQRPWPDILAAVADSADGTGSLDRRHRSSDGQTRWIAWSIRRIDASPGENAAFLCVGGDITERLRATEALAASEARYALVARASNDGIWDWDLPRDVVYYSPRYLDILGLAPQAVEPRMDAWTSRLHPEEAEAVIREYKRCADGEIDTFSVEYRLRHADGDYRHVIGRGGSLRDAKGRVVRMAGSLTDITRRRKDEAALRESQDQLAKIFRFSLVGLCVTSRRDGHILDINEAGARMFGFEKGDVTGQTTLGIEVWNNPQERQAFVEELAQAGAVVGKELAMRHKNGSTVIALVSSVPIQAYGESCILSVLVDITERKAMEQALRRSKEAAEAANRAKSDFLSTMSHEIRTPMNTILGMASVLAEADLPPAQARARAAIEIAGANLMSLLGDILDLSQIEAGGLIMEERGCDVAAMAAELVEMMRPDAARKNLAIALEPVGGALPPRLLISPDRLRQVLVNLLGNAVKFTEKGRIALEVGRMETPPAGPLLRLAVRDTGIGIEPEKREFIFERFTQVNGSTSRQFGGVGLGLAICKKLVGHMGGSLLVDSIPGQGSVFTVTLPLRPAPPAPEVPRPLPGRPAASPAKRGSVLLVEDSPSNAEVIRLMLEGTRFDLAWAPSGVAGLALFREHPFDIVLMDLEMPGLDGLAATEALRRLEAELGRPRTPVVALTAHAFEEHRQKGLAAGCDDFQVKPLSKPHLLEVLEAWLAIGPA